MLISREFRSSIYSFDLVQRRVKKKVKQYSSVKINRINGIGLVGNGSNIKSIFSLFSDEFNMLVKMKSLNSEANRTDVFKNCELIIIAEDEDFSLIEETLLKLEKIVLRTCTILIHTSFQDINRLCTRLKNPSRVAGLHIIDPVGKTPLVEIIRAENTDDVTMSQAFSLINNIGKIPLMVMSSAGLLTGRILGAMIDGGITCLKKGADYNQIEKANVDLGFPIGSIGFLQGKAKDDIDEIQKALTTSWPDRFNSYDVFKAYLDRMNNISSDRIRLDSKKENQCAQDNTEKFFNKAEINYIVLSRVAIEIDCLLKEGVVKNYKDVDTAMLLGLGFPFFNGGITSLLDEKGYSQRSFGEKISEKIY